MIKLAEPVFHSIQGEGIYQGVPMVFIRFAGCNLLIPCNYCDTPYAQDGSRGTEISVEEVLSKVQELAPYYRSWVCITGGEPVFQLDELHSLVKALKRYGYRVEVETNGSIEKPYWWTLVDSWVFDIKCPSSGVCGVSLYDWFETRRADQAKFVVGTVEDLDFSRKVIMENAVKYPTVLVSPVSDSRGKWDEKWLPEVAEFCKELRVRLSLQIHQVIYGNRKGV